MKKVLFKNYFNIKDLAKITNKQTQTIRSWEIKGIIDKPINKDANGWRQYSKYEMITCLERIVKHDWQRKVIKNEKEINLIIAYLKGEVNYEDVISVIK